MSEVQFSDVFDEINSFAEGAPTNVGIPTCWAGSETGLDARGGLRTRASGCVARYLAFTAMNENFSLIVMCLFLLGSLAFLAQQLTSYH